MSFTLAALLAVLTVAALTAASMAVRSVSRIWLRHWVERRLRGAPLAELYLERPQRLIVSAGTGIALAVLLAGGAVAAGASTTVQLTLRLLALGVLVLLLGQTVPRAVARRWPAALVPTLVPVLRAVDVLVAPLRIVGAAIARPFVGRELASPADEARTDIEDLLREGQLEGVGETTELAIITGVVQFGEKTVEQVMTPRGEIFAVDAALPSGEMARRIAASGYSRVPVVRGTLDDVVGMVHVFDVFKTEGETTPPIRRVAEAPVDTPCNELLFSMLRVGRHLAIVRDADGRTAGLVTLEDLLEELVGDIRDEHDEPAPIESATTERPLPRAAARLPDIAPPRGVRPESSSLTPPERSA